MRVDDILIHPRDRDLIVATHGRSIWICDDITPLEQMKKRQARSWRCSIRGRPFSGRTTPQAQRHAANREFKATNPQGGTAINVWAKSDLGKGKVEFLQGTTVVSTMDVDIKAGMNRFQWAGTKPAPPGAANGRGRGGRGNQAANEPGGAAGEAGAQGNVGGGGGGGGGRRGGITGVPFVSGGRGGGGGGGGFGGFGTPSGGPVEPGVYMVRLIVGDHTLTSSVDVLEDTWMRPQ